ncbi:MAG TPA: hypothetical protein VFB50_18570 [Chloroflexota bacterium]|nr:hypothetical protein [Chloroflexota bacterium]
MTHSNRDAQIENFIRRLNGDASAAQRLHQDPIAAVRAAGFDGLETESPVSMYMATIPECLDPPETNHYRNK